jgi:hypothetical protein
VFSILFPFIIYVFEIKGMNVARNITKNREKNVDAQIHSTALDEEDSEGWKEDLLTELADI